MVEQYPDVLIYTIPGTPDVYDEETGTWTPGTPATIGTTKCRAVPSSRKYMPVPDSTVLKYSFVIALPLASTAIAKGTQVELSNNKGDRKFIGELIQFEDGQLHNLAWV